MKTRLSFLIAAAAIFGATPAMGQGFYVGGGIGGGFYDVQFDEIDDDIRSIDGTGTAWKLFGGFSPTRFIGVEGGYRDFGSASTDFGSATWKTSTSGWDVEALGRLTIAIVDIFGKAGVMFWNQDVTIGSSSPVDDSGTDFLWGLGAGVHLGPFGVRGEWESVAISGPSSLSMLSLSATLGF